MTAPPPTTWEHTRCNLCGANDYTLYIPSTLDQKPPQAGEGDWRAYACTSGGYGHHGPIVRCEHCGFVYATPRPQNHEVLDIYTAVEDPLYQQERAGRVLTFEQHLKPLEDFVGPPAHRRLLDVGAYTGVFVEIAARHGWNAWGIEPSQWAVEQARAQGLQMIPGALEEADLAPESYAVITMWDVIEHVTDPLGTFQAAWRALEPGGILVVHTMDLNSPFARLMGRRWPWFMEMHLCYFSRQTMTAFLEKADFEIVWMGAQGRYLHVGYLASRVTALAPLFGRPLEWLVRKLQLGEKATRVNLGDLFTTYARKVDKSPAPR